MKLRKLCSPRIVLSALVPVALVACGDDVTNTTNNVTGAKTVADLAAAGTCDAAATGEIVLNTEDGALYVCNGKKWISTMGEGGANGENGCDLNSVTVDGVEGVEIVCGNAKDTVLNGAKGNPGVGVDGTGCVSSSRKDDDGVTQAVIVVCGDRADTLIARGGILVCGGMAYDSATTRRLCDTRNDKSYKYVRIGGKDWMAENLDYDYKVGGASYGNGPGTRYGRLYTWAAAMDSATTSCGFEKLCTPSSPVQGVCPDGWHLPDSTEYASLIQTAGGRNSAAKKLRAATGWLEGTEATDDFGFAALPSSDGPGGQEFFFAWSSSEYTTAYARELGMTTANTIAYFEEQSKKAMSAVVRCVKD